MVIEREKLSSRDNPNHLGDQYKTWGDAYKHQDIHVNIGRSLDVIIRISLYM